MTESLNPLSVIPPIPTDAGSALPSQVLQMAGPVVPTFKLPDDGHKSEDKHSKNQQHALINEAEQKIEEEKAKFEEFVQFAEGHSFSEMYLALFNYENSDVESIKRDFRDKNGIQELKLYSAVYAEGAQAATHGQQRYTATQQYYQMKPGARFRGKM